MRWVVEDYAALAAMFEAAEGWRQNAAASTPGRLILRLRRGLQVSQLELARRTGVPRSLIARIEAGKDFQVSSLQRVMKALGCSLIMLPASEALLAEFKAKATLERQRLKEWKEAREKLR